MNKCIFVGNLTRDPETRTTQNGVTVCNFTIAVNRKMRSDGAQDADFINIVAWRQLGELCAKYLSKGKKCGVVGQLQMRTYEAQDGSKRSAFDIVADEVEFLSPAGGQAGQNAYQTAVNKEPAAPAEFTKAENEELPF